MAVVLHIMAYLQMLISRVVGTIWRGIVVVHLRGNLKHYLFYFTFRCFLPLQPQRKTEVSQTYQGLGLAWSPIVQKKRWEV